MDIELDTTEEGTCTNVFIILGKRRSGKTTLLSALVRSIAANGRVVVVDPVGSAGALLKRPYHRVFAASGNKQTERFFKDLYRQAEEGREYLLVIDEADEYTNLNGQFSSESLYRLLNYGRNFGVGIVACSRRAANLPKDFLSNSDCLCLFSHHEPNDLDYLGGMLSDSRGRDYVVALRNLPEHIFLLWETSSPDPFRGFFQVQDGAIVAWRPGPSEGTAEASGYASDAPGSSTGDSEAPTAPNATETPTGNPSGSSNSGTGPADGGNGQNSS